MPRRYIWKGSFFDAFLLRMKKKRDLLLNRKIWSRRSYISPEFVDCSVRIYNEKLLFVVRSLKERLVINLESLLLHGNEDLREKRLDQPGKRMIDQQRRGFGIRFHMLRAASLKAAGSARAYSLESPKRSGFREGVESRPADALSNRKND